MNEDAQRDAAAHDLAVDHNRLSRNLLLSLRFWIVIVVIATATLCVMVLPPMLWRAQEAKRAVTTQANMKEIATALHRYAADHDDGFPPLDTWQQDLIVGGYLDAESLRSHYAPTGGHAFALNSAMTGLKPSDLKDLDRFVFLFEVDPGTMRHGGLDDLKSHNDGSHSFVVLFADGHVERLDATELALIDWNILTDD